MKNAIWPWFDDEFKAYCERNEGYRQIMSWKGARPWKHLLLPGRHCPHDVIIPASLHNRAAELLGIEQRIRARAKVRKLVSQSVVGQ